MVDYDSDIMINCDWVKIDAERRRAGADPVTWIGDFDLPDIGDVLAVWPGCCVGTVVDYGIKIVGDRFERAVWTKLGNREFIKLTGRECKPVTDEEIQKIELQNVEFKRRLVSAGKKVERQRKERRQRQVKGSHLLDEMLSLAGKSGLQQEEKSSFYKISGSTKGRYVYVATKGGRVDLSGFCFDHKAVTTITEDEATRRHLGKVRGTLNFDVGDESAMQAYQKALSLLNS